ncbi:MAG: rhodanese-like domain-containing protein [bacterium]
MTPTTALPRTTSTFTLLVAVALALLSLFSGIGCTRSTSDRDLVYRKPSELIELANTPGGAFGAGALPKVLWLDPRSPKAFAEGHIPQATSIPFPEIERTHEVSCRGYEMYFVYDTDYDDVLAKASAKRLIELGYKNVYCMLGGLKAWRSDGNEVKSSLASETAPAVAPSLKPAK